MASPTFDELQDVLTEAKDLSREEAYTLLREKVMLMEDESLLRSWFLREIAKLLDLPI